MFRVFNCLTTQHDWRLIVLAGVVCFLTSFAAVSLFHRARSLGGRSRTGWMLTAGAATGCGIWATHFIAILAYEPGIPLAYDIWLTAVSLFAAMIVTTAGMTWAVYGRSLGSVAVGGAMIGAAIACMHYLGIAAVRMAGDKIWAFDLVAFSVVIGIVLGAAAFVAAAHRESIRWTALAGGLLTLAIVSHHFTGMGAIGIIPNAIHDIHSHTLTPGTLSLVVSIVSICVLAMCLVGAWSDRRTREAMKQQNTRLDAALNNMNQGLCMFDANDRLLDWNERYRAMFRIDPKRIWAGASLTDLLDARVAAGTFPLEPTKYTAELRATLKQGMSFTTNMELADGRTICLVNQPMPGGGWVATHEDVTERMRSARELDSTRSFLDTIISNVPTPVVVKSLPELKYILLNKAAEKLFGASSEMIIGKTPHDLFPKNAADAIHARDLEVVRTGKEAFSDEHSLTGVNGESRIVTSTRLLIPGPDGTPQYMIGVFHDVTERKRDQARIEYMAHHDTLTDLPNRAAFNECLSATMEAAQKNDEKFALLCIDLDRFKEVNDLFGHSTGDVLLREVAQRLETSCEGAFLARVGGDEFMAITSVGPQPATAEALASRLSRALEDDIVIDGQPMRVGLTVGVAIYPTDGTTATTLIANADAALYRAKSEARGSIRFFEIDMDKQLREKRSLQHDLRSAIANGQLEVYYQPQGLIGGEVIGFEALVRWHHPVRGMVSPGTFIPLAEESGLILPIGEWVLREACREAASWPNSLRIGVNLSPAQFQHGDLVGLVHSILLETGLSAGRLELEITEGVLIGDFSRAVSILRRLKSLGVRIAMDDFGTGYSSLSYLHAFPFDKIKIDQAFVANIGRSQNSADIIRAVIGLAHGLDLPVLAEGVETDAQRRFLAAEKCDEMQGYLLGRPQPIAAYADILGRAATAKPSAKTLRRLAAAS